MVLKVFTSLVVLSAILMAAQDTPASTKVSIIPFQDILKLLGKECPHAPLPNGYTVTGTKTTARQGLGIFPESSFNLTALDPDKNTFHIAIDRPSLGNAVKELCHALKTSVMIEVVDTQNLTQSTDVRGDASGGVVAAIVNDNTGRRTHTDTASIYVVVNGEHALLDCYERRTGCATIRPGKYYGERDGDGIWVNYQMPITHKPMRNHYKIAGSW